MAGGAEAGHVAAGLRHDDLGRGPADAGDRGQQLKLAGERADLLPDPRRQLTDRLGELVNSFRPMPLELHDPEDLDSESGHPPALDFTRRMATGVSRGRGSRAAAPSGGP